MDGVGIGLWETKGCGCLALINGLYIGTIAITSMLVGGVEKAFAKRRGAWILLDSLQSP